MISLSPNLITQAGLFIGFAGAALSAFSFRPSVMRTEFEQGNVTSRARPSHDAVRRNAYWRMFGLDLLAASFLLQLASTVIA